MARLSLAAVCCCVTLLSTSSAKAQDLAGNQGPRPVEGGPVDLAQLTQLADLVVHGFVTGKKAAWVGRVVYTLYDMSVQETLKGAPRNSLEVAVAGGAIGNVRLRVPGAPDLQIGEQIVVFSKVLQGTTFTPVGTFDGVVRVNRGPGGSLTVAPRGKPEPLEAFLDEVRSLGGR